MTTREPARPVTGYAVLGLLSLRPWTTYELAQQVRRSLHWFWTRAERRIYEEPKRLVENGWVEAREGWTGKRRHTTYAITDAGREALATWLGTPAQVRTVEDEAMLRVFFADVRRQVDQETDTLAWATWARRQTDAWASATDPGGWDTGRVLREVLADARA